jgi:hypothetical protein
MSPFTVCENVLRLEPVEPDPFIATSIAGSVPSAPDARERLQREPVVLEAREHSETPALKGP